MINDRQVVLTTFAGRRDRMKLLLSYARRALESGIIDEWHVWDFARTQEDRAWLNQEFPIIRRLPDRINFRPVCAFERDANGIHAFDIAFRARSDFFIRLLPAEPHLPCYELVVGGWGNTRMALRRLPGAVRADQAFEDAGGEEIVSIFSPGIASDAVFKHLHIDYQAGNLSVSINDRLLLNHPIELDSKSITVCVCTAYGSSGEIDMLAPGNRQYLFASRNDGLHPFGEFYNYYASRYETYKSTVFLKCDDDIIYFDLNKLSEFIKFRIENEKYFLVSANVINNSVCADFQQKSHLIPLETMDLDTPPGRGAKLLTEGLWAEELHKLFLAGPEVFTKHHYETQALAVNGRFSINFVSWLGKDLTEMACHYTDDEKCLSVDLPSRLGRSNVIFMPFVASHLSFFTQDKWFNVHQIIEKYGALRDHLMP